MTPKPRIALAGSAAVLVAVAVYFVTRQPPAESPGMTAVEARAANVEVDGAVVAKEVEDLARSPVRRSVVTGEPSGGVSAVAGSHLLRLVLVGTTVEHARRATVTALGVEQSNERLVRIQDPWPCQGVTSGFDLDPFLARLAERGELRADELVVEVDHPLHFSETARVALSSGVKLGSGQTVHEVRVQLSEVVYWPELTLAVRDANTRAHLEDVELRCVPTAYMGLVQQPGESEVFTVIGGGLSSPIVIRGGRKAGEPEEMAAGLALVPGTGESLKLAQLVQPEETERGVMVYARSPGHAWGRLVLDVSKGARRELLLGPDATLDVRLANVQPERYAALEKRATLFVRGIRPDGNETTVWSRSLDQTLDTEVLRIESLEPGEYAALVELSSSWKRKPMELGREIITLPTGEAREVLLALPDPPEPAADATLGGVVSFPSFGGEEKVRLEFYGSDYQYGDPDVELSLTELEPVAGARPAWSFRVELPVGRHQVRMMPFVKSWMIELPDVGRDDVELVIPELAEVLVETVDARTGERIPLEEIAYKTLEVLPGQVTLGGSRPFVSVDFEGEPGRFRFWTAPGAMAVRTRGSQDYGPFTEELELVAGLQSMHLELAPSCTIRFEFRVDGAALPFEDRIHHGLSRCIRAVGHDGRVGDLYPYSLVLASAPGFYDISFEGVGADRFHPIPPRRVELRAGQTTEVIVELLRRQ